MNKSILRNLVILALSIMLLCSFSVGALAYAEDTAQQITISTGGEVTPVVTPSPTPTPTPTVTPTITDGDAFSEAGNAATRDLLYDKASNKQFITVETKNGSTFYIVIDYDAPINEDEEQYQTYFLNLVDDRDLKELLGEEAAEAACSCLVKCEAGEVNSLCEVCKNTMSECLGVQTQAEEPDVDEIPEEPVEDEGGVSMFAVIVVVAAVVLAVYYFKFIRNKDGDDAASDFFGNEEYSESEYINEDEA